MRLLIQRVKQASVEIDGKLHSAINKGLLVFVGITHNDNQEDLEWLTQKLIHLRVFSDEEGKMNLDALQAGGEILVVSQFTLFASTRKGNRPSFADSAPPAVAVPLYEEFIARLNKLLPLACKTGEFGADMQVNLCNDGPVTILIDSKTRE